MIRPGSNRLARAPKTKLLSGQLTCATRRRTEKTRPCSSNGTCACQIACECSGVGAKVEYSAVPCSADLRPLRDQARVVRAILAGGDDYELCFTAAPSRAAEIEALSTMLDITLTRIGGIVEGDAVAVVDATGRTLTVKDKGFDHFS